MLARVGVMVVDAVVGGLGYGCLFVCVCWKSQDFCFVT